MSWKKIIKPKYAGCLGIRDSRAANVSLLGRLIWEFIRNPNKYLHNEMVHPMFGEVLFELFFNFDQVLGLLLALVNLAFGSVTGWEHVPHVIQLILRKFMISTSLWLIYGIMVIKIYSDVIQSVKFQFLPILVEMIHTIVWLGNNQGINTTS